MGTAQRYKPGPVSTKTSGGLYADSLGSLTRPQKLDLRTIYSRTALLASTWAALTRLRNVKVAGPLLPGLVSAWPLESLVLTNIDPDGSLPVELCKSSLQTLNVSGNHLSGEIPRCLGRFPAASFNDSSNWAFRKRGSLWRASSLVHLIVALK